MQVPERWRVWESKLPRWPERSCAPASFAASCWHWMTTRDNLTTKLPPRNARGPFSDPRLRPKFTSCFSHMLVNGQWGRTPRGYLPVGFCSSLVNCCRGRETASVEIVSIYTLFCTSVTVSQTVECPMQVIHTTVLNVAHLQNIMQMKEFQPFVEHLTFLAWLGSISRAVEMIRSGQCRYCGEGGLTWFSYHVTFDQTMEHKIGNPSTRELTLILDLLNIALLPFLHPRGRGGKSNTLFCTL